MALAEFSSTTISRQDPTALEGRNPDPTVLWLRGEHDISTVAALSETMADAIALDDGDLVVDLSGVEFIGAATVGVIVRAHNLLRLRSRSLVVRSPTKSAKRMLDLCGLAGLLDGSSVGVAPTAGAAGEPDRRAGLSGTSLQGGPW